MELSPNGLHPGPGAVPFALSLQNDRCAFLRIVPSRKDGPLCVNG